LLSASRSSTVTTRRPASFADPGLPRSEHLHQPDFSYPSTASSYTATSYRAQGKWASTPLPVRRCSPTFPIRRTPPIYGDVLRPSLPAHRNPGRDDPASWFVRRMRTSSNGELDGHGAPDDSNYLNYLETCAYAALRLRSSPATGPARTRWPGRSSTRHTSPVTRSIDGYYEKLNYVLGNPPSSTATSPP